jgi:glycine/D-amino acid oxidase-like deaminating enzyme
MQTDVLIVGQGICGTLLSWFLKKEGQQVVVIDDDRPHTATMAAAGIINPVTGRRYVYSWMIDEVMPFAISVYEEMGAALEVKAVMEKSIIDFFPSPQMREAFATRITEDDTWLHTYPDQNHFNRYFQHDFGCGEIRPAYSIQLALLQAAWRKLLWETGSFVNETFDHSSCSLANDRIQYKGITAERIVFCDGIAALKNPWFAQLPFSPNKGEALLIHCRDLSNRHIFKKGLMLAPLPVQDTFWVGSNYQWEFENALPSEAFYNQTKKHLQQWLKLPFEIIGHKAAIRPATLERRPFVGFHPMHPQIGILNGMGTKGSSLAPFFARQLAGYIVHGFPVHEEASVQRFSRILSK